MRILHLKQTDFTTSAWSGGTTTELFIWPEGASYARREFGIRISSAMVELAESDFTPLPGVLRYITPLSGSFTLSHPGKAPVAMGPLSAPYRFPGGESTHCVGSATDFNLMLRGVEGEMTLGSGRIPVKPGLNAFFAPGERYFTVGGQGYAMDAGQLLVIFADEAGIVDLGPEISLVCFAKI